MKFSVARDSIYKSLQNIIGVVPTKTTTPILNNVLFELNGDLLKITATDLEILTSTTINVKGQDDGMIAIPAKFLNDIIREMANEEVSFEQEDGHKIKLRTEKGEYKISGEPGDDFPVMPMDDEMNGFTIKDSTIHRMIEKSLFAVSMDELRPALMGIFFQINSNELKLVGTDGHRLSRIINKDFSYDGTESDLIVPTKALALVNKNLKQEDESIEIKFSNNFIFFDLPGIQIYSRLVDSEYPDYEGVIPSGNDKEVIASTAELLGSVRRVSIFSSSLTHQVQFSLKNNIVEITSQDIDVGGEGREEINVNFKGESLDIAFNAQYFIDVLKHVDTNQTKLLLNSSVTAAMVLPIEQNKHEDILMLLMPVRLNDYTEHYENKSYSEGASNSTD